MPALDEPTFLHNRESRPHALSSLKRNPLKSSINQDPQKPDKVPNLLHFSASNTLNIAFLRDCRAPVVAILAEHGDRQRKCPTFLAHQWTPAINHPLCRPSA